MTELRFKPKHESRMSEFSVLLASIVDISIACVYISCNPSVNGKETASAKSNDDLLVRQPNCWFRSQIMQISKAMHTKRNYSPTILRKIYPREAAHRVGQRSVMNW